MFTIIAPLDSIRLEQFAVSKRIYDSMPEKKEFVIPTRTFEKVREYLETNDLIKDVRLIPYTIDKGFNVSKALNIGVREAKYDHIVITSPEVKPTTNVLAQFKESLGQNIICQVWDEDENGKIAMSLVHNGFRSDTPAMYFLALFNKKDIEAINGWDEDFLNGYAYEDDDFGHRWVRAGLPFTVREDIQGVHQYHPRSETIPNGLSINANKLHENDENGVIKCKNGLKML